MRPAHRILCGTGIRVLFLFVANEEKHDEENTLKMREMETLMPGWMRFGNAYARCPEDRLWYIG